MKQQSLGPRHSWQVPTGGQDGQSACWLGRSGLSPSGGRSEWWEQPSSSKVPKLTCRGSLPVKEKLGRELSRTGDRKERRPRLKQGDMFFKHLISIRKVSKLSSYKAENSLQTVRKSQRCACKTGRNNQDLKKSTDLGKLRDEVTEPKGLEINEKTTSGIKTTSEGTQRNTQQMVV